MGPRPERRRRPRPGLPREAPRARRPPRERRGRRLHREDPPRRRGGAPADDRPRHRRHPDDAERPPLRRRLRPPRRRAVRPAGGDLRRLGLRRALPRGGARRRPKISTGFFDDDFFVYREDVDLAWRLRGRGWRARCVPAAVAWHRRRNLPERRREMSPLANLHSVKNRFLLRVNNAGPAHLRATFGRSFARDLLVVGGCLTVERTSLPALRWLALNRDAPPRQAGGDPGAAPRLRPRPPPLVRGRPGRGEDPDLRIADSRDARDPGRVRRLRDAGRGAFRPARGARARRDRLRPPERCRLARPVAPRRPRRPPAVRGPQVPRDGRPRRRSPRSTLPPRATTPSSSATPRTRSPAGSPGLLGAPTRVVLNVDGLERHRRKWNALGKLVYALSERLCCVLPDAVVSDALVIRDYYRSRYGKETTFIPYGADLPAPEGTSTLSRLGLAPRALPPLRLALRAGEQPRRGRPRLPALSPGLKLALVGSAPVRGRIHRRGEGGGGPRSAGRGPRRHLRRGLPGAPRERRRLRPRDRSGRDAPRARRGDGLRPPLLVHDTPENREVAGDTALYWDARRPETLAAALARLESDPAGRDARAACARERALGLYRWENVADAYERLLSRP